MKKIIALLCIVFLISCESNHSKNQNSKTADTLIASKKTNDTTPKVIGIGGIFFYADSLQKSTDWYTANLGIEMNDWGSASFESRDLNDSSKINSLQWKPFEKGDDYFKPSGKDFMINYQVQNLEGLIVKLKENGVTILDSIAEYDYGKFVHIMDPEGNKIELWEPSPEETQAE